jgi:hypothetical protein
MKAGENSKLQHPSSREASTWEETFNAQHSTLNIECLKFGISLVLGAWMLEFFTCESDSCSE